MPIGLPTPSGVPAPFVAVPALSAASAGRTAPAAEAKRSSRESAVRAGPASSVASSYNCPHQSSS
ncbi:hypothetical protein ACFU6S_09950 [Streptomyces sp. NPDC057456]|uniref:hypothetical protein n=1 Tax=Streptomyces sp. NPDC057456 TaxID=3346139 RepID=UPI0036CB5320